MVRSILDIPEFNTLLVEAQSADLERKRRASRAQLESGWHYLDRACRLIAEREHPGVASVPAHEIDRARGSSQEAHLVELLQAAREGRAQVFDQSHGKRGRRARGDRITVDCVIETVEVNRWLRDDGLVIQIGAEGKPTQRKLSDAVIEEVRARFSKGEKVASIARWAGVTRKTIDKYKQATPESAIGAVTRQLQDATIAPKGRRGSGSS
jgi:hypothetical protein